MWFIMLCLERRVSRRIDGCLNFVIVQKNYLRVPTACVLCMLSSIAEFLLETENQPRQETSLKTENSSDMNLVKIRFLMLNLSVHFPI